MGFVDVVRLLLVVSFAMIFGCARNPVPEPPPLPRGPAFVNLEAGWRVRVVTPKLKSGGFLMKTAEQKAEGATITLRATDEFLGYETATYNVLPVNDGGVRVVPGEVEFNQGGATARSLKSFAPRMSVPGRFRHVRLVYMQKVSDADHATGIVAARNRIELDLLTRRLLADPGTDCRISRQEYCEWIPAGVAIRPERLVNEKWIPAR